MASWDFWIPTRGYGVIDAVNRMALATGSPRSAMKAAGANYNGHRFEVTWNDYKGHYVAGYTWSGFNRIWRGTFEDCLAVALRAHDQGQLGSSVVVRLREGDEESLATCRASKRLEPWSEEAVDALQATWPWQCRSPRGGHTRIAYSAEAVRLERTAGVPLSLFAQAESLEAWRTAVETWRSDRRSSRTGERG